MAMVTRKRVDRLISSSQLFKRARGCMFVRFWPRPSTGGNAKPSFNSQGNFVYRENLIRNRDGKELGYFGGLDKNVIFKHQGLNSTSRHDTCDFLGANKLGRNFLIRGKDDKRVPVESLRGKILCLYFVPAISRHFVVPCVLREFYNTLKLTNPDAFEMIYVTAPLPPDADPSLHNAIISTLPWLAVPVDDLNWRSYLFHSYSSLYTFGGVFFIDTRDNKTEIPLEWSGDSSIYHYGPLLFPFTDEREEQLNVQVKQLGKETSIQAILGSDSRDYLIDRHSNKVPISSLQNKDVLIFAHSNSDALYVLPFVKRLEEIYNKFLKHSFEIVSINFDHNGGNEKYEKLWKDHLAQIPWLHFPLRDEKIWLLRTMMIKVDLFRKGPILFVKPKGESLLDPYGYEVYKNFGIQAFPFSRKAAAQSVVTRLKGLSFKSYVDKASHLGLDFNSLIRNKANGGTEHVSLSTVLKERARGVLLLFASLETCSQKRLKSLIDVYLSQDESSSSFEVIFVSTDKDTQSFDDHFSVMPWFAFQKPLKQRECKELAERTIDFDFGDFSHFLAFGPDQLLLQVGLLTKSFKNCEFPFVNDAESTDHVAFHLTTKLGLRTEADGTVSYCQGHELWNGIEHDFYHFEENRCFSDEERDCFEDTETCVV